MVNSIYYYRIEANSTVYYCQCEWYNNILDLNPNDQTPLCSLTVTDLTDYWTHEVKTTSLAPFTHSGFTITNLNSMITVALKGQSDYHDKRIQWRLKENDTRQCEMSMLFYVDPIIPTIIGSITLDKAPQEQYHSIRVDWFNKNIHLSLVTEEAQKASNLLIEELEKTKKILDDRLRELAAKSSSDKLLMIDKFHTILNAKKMKIRELLEKKDSQAQSVHVEHNTFSESSNTMISSGANISYSQKDSGSRMEESSDEDDIYYSMDITHKRKDIASITEDEEDHSIHTYMNKDDTTLSNGSESDSTEDGLTLFEPERTRT